jgi:hypothetical protein
MYDAVFELVRVRISVEQDAERVKACRRPEHASAFVAADKILQQRGKVTAGRVHHQPSVDVVPALADATFQPIHFSGNSLAADKPPVSLEVFSRTSVHQKFVPF